MASPNETVLVTGGSGFIGSHCILQALQKGYTVRTTLRNLQRSDDVRKSLKVGGATEEQVANVHFVAVDLTKDDGWDEACAGCAYVLHVASPFPPGAPKHEDDLIVPAKEGTLRALNAAKKAQTVKRVVITSSVAAVQYGYGKEADKRTFTEEEWSVLDGSKGDKVPAYQKSKTIAERAAWEWHAKEGGGLEIVTVNPVGVFGPVLSADFATSVQIVSRLLDGQVPAIPNMSVGIVDVRDVADLHLRAMTDPKAAGQRFIATSGENMWFKEIALTLKRELPKQDARRVSTISAPNFAVRILGLFDPAVGLIGSELGKEIKTSNAKAKNELGWAPRSAKEAILASATSLKERGALKK